DVPARLTAVLVVDGVDVTVVVRGPARGLDRRDELVEGLVRVDDAVVGRPGVVLHLFAAEDVGRLEVVHQDRREPIELRLRIGRVEVLEVERPDRDLVQARGGRALRRDAVVYRA